MQQKGKQAQVEAAKGLAKRVRWIIDNIEGGNRSEFARIARITPQHAAKIYDGSPPGGAILALIAAAYQDKVSIEWLLTGSGSPTTLADPGEAAVRLARVRAALEGPLTEEEEFLVRAVRAGFDAE